MKREPLLDPIDRVSEILFGLIMAVTIVGSAAIASGEANPGRAATIAALGCNIAWGLVDAVMYLLRTATERTHLRRIGLEVQRADSEAARSVIAASLPDFVRAITGDEEIEGMRRRIQGLQPQGQRTLGAGDFLEAFGIFLLVVIATFPVALPFLIMSDTRLAMQVSRVITLVMLCVLGFALGRYAGYRKPIYTGLAMAALIAMVKALGG